MSGKEHMTLGTTCSLIFIFSLITLGNTKFNLGMIILVAGAVIGSYMPDIDSQQSTASQFFNKVLTILMVIIAIIYFLGINVHMPFINILNNYIHINKNGLIFFCILTLLGKLSPHRMFTHKWFGTFCFCLSIYRIGNDYLFIGFTLGYILHIVADRISKNGKYLKFFEFKLPLKNSRNKTSISW